ncbi:MAG: glycosyltransferase family 4 protein [Syntrophobacteraceae bacterium]
MKVAFYCPNKPLNHPNPSGDLIIARSIRDALQLSGHDCREIVAFRSRWFWTSLRGRISATGALVQAAVSCLRFQPDLWLTYHTYYKSPDAIGPVLTRLLRIPYVLFQPMFGTRRRKDPATCWGYSLNRMALRSSSHVFTNNLNDLEALHRVVPQVKLTYLPPGIFPESSLRISGAREQVRQRYAIPERHHLLLTAARLRPGVKEASIRFLFDALAELQRTRDDWTLLLAGDGPMEQALREAAASKLGRRVIFVGGVPHDQMPLLYSAADLFVFPGIGESLGMVYLEAQACGAPVVALASAGVAQVVLDGETGILVEPPSPQTMADAISRLLVDTATRGSMGRAGIAFVRTRRNLHLNYQELARRLELLANAKEEGFH